MVKVAKIPYDAYEVENNSSPGMFQCYRFGRPTLYSGMMEDFHVYESEDWTITSVGAGTIAQTDATFGALLLTNAAADNDCHSLQYGAGEGFTPTVGKRIFFEARLKVSDATQSDFMVGLSDTDTTPLDSSDGIFFIKSDGGTGLDCRNVSASTAAQESSVFTVLNNTYIKLGYVVHGRTSVDFYVNDVFVTTVNTQIPTTQIRPTVHIQNGEAVAKTMELDYIFCEQER